MKEETIEEAANKIYPNDGYDDETYCDFGELCRDKWLEGAKWVQERMYSEEEVKGMCDKYHNQMCLYGNVKAQEWFEQFKKK
jgi:hypothetical protein